MEKDFFDKVGDVWDMFTGKDDFDEAKKLYEQAFTVYQSHKDAYQKDYAKIKSSIDGYLQDIYNIKVKMKKELFPSYLEKIKKLNARIDDNICQCVDYSSHFQPDEMKQRDELFLIDFEKNPVTSTLKALVSFGFWSRSEAKKSLLRVKEEISRLKEEVAKMNSHLDKCRLIEKAIAVARHYFVELASTFSLMLNRLDNSSNYLTVNAMISNNYLPQQKLNRKDLPLYQQKEMEAATTMAKIMSSMTQVDVVDNSSGEVSKSLEGTYQNAIENFNAI